MGNIFIGDSSSKARKVTNAYVGVDGVARKIKQIYVGDSSGIARLVWKLGGNYLFCKYWNTDSSSRRDIFSCFNRNGSTFTRITAPTISTSSQSLVEYSRDDAKVVAHNNFNKIDFYRLSGNNYTLSFSASMAFSDLKAYVPNSGNTAFIHSALYASTSTDLFGLSANGKYFYIGLVGYTTGSVSSYEYTSIILIFDISNNSLNFKQAIHIKTYNTNYGSLGDLIGTASDDLGVFAVAYDVDDGYSTTTKEKRVLIGAIGEDYTSTSNIGSSVSSYGYTYAIYNQTPYHALKVSPSGKYVTFFMSSSSSSTGTIYYINGYVTVDRTNKKTSSPIALVSAQSDFYTYPPMNYEFVRDDYIYSINKTANYYDLMVFKNNNGTFSKTSRVTLTIPTSPSENYDPSASMGYYKKLTGATFDFDTNIGVFFEGRGRYDICSLNGSNGTFTGYSRIDGGSFNDTVNVKYAYIN